MKLVLTILKWLVGGILGFVAIIGLCWWLLPDQALNPKVEQLLAESKTPYPANSAFFAIWGFPASPELDVPDVGQRIAAAHDQSLATDKNLSKFKLESFYGKNPLGLPQHGKRMCDFKKEPCLALYQSKQAEIEAQSEAHKGYLARYRSLREAPFSGTLFARADLRSPIPAWGQIGRIGELVDGSIALRMKSPNKHQAALEELLAEIAFWQGIVQSNDGLLTQMVAVNALASKYRLASEILNTYPEIFKMQPKLVAEITLPLPVAKTSVVTSFAGEARYIMSAMQREFVEVSSGGSFMASLDTAPWYWTGFVGGYRTKATQNEAYRHYSAVFQFLEKSPKDVLAGYKANEEQLRKASQFSPLDIFFNPLGRVINATAHTSYAEYAFRVHDLVGLSRLLDLQRRAIETGVELEKMPAFLAASDPSLFDVFTEKPMLWDATANRIAFVGHSARKAEYSYIQIASRK